MANDDCHGQRTNGDPIVLILVPVKRVIDYNVKPRVKADGTSVDLAALLQKS
jgi:hypothetical protein